MKIDVRVKPNSRMEEVTQEGMSTFTVRTREPPIEGRANRAVVKLLAKHLGIRESQLRIVKGLKSKTKVIEIM